MLSLGKTPASAARPPEHHSPVTMKTEIDLDAIIIDGARLKAAREERGSTVAEMAAAITLSREQIQHIEDGGNRPFYTPAHKLLAVRKYANALDIAYDEVVTGPGADQTIPVPDDAPVSMMSHADVPEPTDLRLAAVERNAEIRRVMTLGAIAICILIAVYAKLRGSQDDTREQETQAEVSVVEPEDKPEPEPVAAAAPAAPPVKPVISPAPPAVLAPEPRPVVSEAKTEPAPKAEVPKLAAETGDECVARASGDVKTWAPAFHRKADSRLYLISPRGGSVCVVDASGKATPVSLKPMVGQAIGGKPPYVVRSSDLAKIEMYMQGLRVKIPADAAALKLVPATQPAPAETSASPDT